MRTPSALGAAVFDWLAPSVDTFDDAVEGRQQNDA
jgi:hypothetical protein